MSRLANAATTLVRRFRRQQPSVAFFTVCGGGEEYEFLLGSVEHHASMGRQFVLDTTPAPHARTFTRLPPTVTWVHEPIYGRGWEHFRCRSALARAAGLAETSGAEVVVWLDCDEFYTQDSVHAVFAGAVEQVTEVFTVHHHRDGTARLYGTTEWHRRAWPARRGVEIVSNPDWISHPDFDGNPERHPVVKPPAGLGVVRVPGSFHHHVHYAVGSKAAKFETAASVIEGWNSGGTAIKPTLWPEMLRAWRDHGTLPSRGFEA